MSPSRPGFEAQLHDQPPLTPERGRSCDRAVELELRYWAWRASGHVNEPEDIRIFVLYHDPALTPVVPHSLGLAKGLIGVVYAFAAPEMTGENAVVIAHEMLHTVGASDKYLPAPMRRVFPMAMAILDQVPLYPQRAAEADGGTADAQSRPVAAAESLDEVVIGPPQRLKYAGRSTRIDTQLSAAD